MYELRGSLLVEHGDTGYLLVTTQLSLLDRVGLYPICLGLQLT